MFKHTFFEVCVQQHLRFWGTFESTRMFCVHTFWLYLKMNVNLDYEDARQVVLEFDIILDNLIFDLCEEDIERLLDFLLKTSCT